MKRFNYTGRKKILREDIKIRLQSNIDEIPKIDVAIDLGDYGFPPTSDVFLEPQRKTRFMRLHLGRIASTVRKNGITLNEFDDADDLDFRVKIVDENAGLLFGIAENIKPYNKDDKVDDNQESILPVSSTDLSMHGVLWRIDIDGEKATLQVERELGSRDQVVRSQLFRGFILPAAMRQILSRVVSNDWDKTLADPEELATRWLLFAKQMGAGVPNCRDDIEDKERWVDEVVRILGNRIGVRQQIIDDFSSGAWK